MQQSGGPLWMSTQLLSKATIDINLDVSKESERGGSCLAPTSEGGQSCLIVM